jgi:hypothetical protein
MMRLTEQEIQFVKDNDALMTINQMALTMGRSKGTLDKLRRKLGLRKDICKPWAEEEVIFVRDHPRLSGQEIGERLGRTASAISSYRKYNGLRMTRTCVMCENDFVSHHSATKICKVCWPLESRTTQSPMLRYAYYQENAARRDIEFNISHQEFYVHWQKPCSYCGAEIETIGLDRIDSAQGYSPENITPCCSRCNEMKMAETKDGWIAQMKKILNHLGEI